VDPQTSTLIYSRPFDCIEIYIKHTLIKSLSFISYNTRTKYILKTLLALHNDFSAVMLIYEISTGDMDHIAIVPDEEP
jgi:hypothetical protein